MTAVTDYHTVYEVMERYFPSGVASTGVVTGLNPLQCPGRSRCDCRDPGRRRLRWQRLTP